MQWGCWHSSSWTIWTSPSYFSFPMTTMRSWWLVSSKVQNWLLEPGGEFLPKGNFKEEKKSPSSPKQFTSSHIRSHSQTVLLFMCRWACFLLTHTDPIPKASLFVSQSKVQSLMQNTLKTTERFLLTLFSYSRLYVMGSEDTWVWKSSFACT